MNTLKYNENQKEAIGWNEGAVMVLAGPGAGKTTVLTDRIARLVQETPEESFRVLALTFTRQAAKEMKRRLEKSLGDDISRVEAETFHAFAMDVLLRYGSVINLKPDFIISENGADCRQILQKILAKVELQGMDAENVLSGFDVILRNGLSAEELLEYIIKRQDIADRFSQLKSVFEAYVEALIKEGVMDYPMMLYLAKYVLETHPKLLEKIRLIYKYFCVDEFQDTTVIQYRILGLIAPPGANVFVVADDDQTIFEWNGANPLRVKEFIREYEANIIQLPQNYRCPDEIVKMSNALIIRNTERYAGKIQCYSSNKDKDVVGYETFYDWDSEVRGLCKNIKDSIPTNSRHNCLVIARNNWMLKDVKRIFAECGVAAEIIAQRNEFASSQVSWVYHYLRFIRYPQSKVAPWSGECRGSAFRCPSGCIPEGSASGRRESPPRWQRLFPSRPAQRYTDRRRCRPRSPAGRRERAAGSARDGYRYVQRTWRSSFPARDFLNNSETGPLYRKSGPTSSRPCFFSAFSSFGQKDLRSGRFLCIIVIKQQLHKQRRQTKWITKN